MQSTLGLLLPYPGLAQAPGNLVKATALHWIITAIITTASSVKASIIEYHHLSESHKQHRNYEPGSSCLSTGVPTLTRQTKRPAAELIIRVVIAVAVWQDTRALAIEFLVLLLRAKGKLGCYWSLNQFWCREQPEVLSMLVTVALLAVEVEHTIVPVLLDSMAVMEMQPQNFTGQIFILPPLSSFKVEVSIPFLRQPEEIQNWTQVVR